MTILDSCTPETRKEINRLLSSDSARNMLKRWIRQALDMDSCDALQDARSLVALLEEVTADLVGRPHIPASDPGYRYDYQARKWVEA